MKYDAACTWGDGPDVLLIINCEKHDSNHYDLTVDQALYLSAKLESAARHAQELERSAEFHQLHEMKARLPAQHIWNKGQKVVVVSGEEPALYGKNGVVTRDSQDCSPYWTLIQIGNIK